MEMIRDVDFGALYCREMILLAVVIDVEVWLVVRDLAQYSFHQFHNQVVHHKLIAWSVGDVLDDPIMQQFDIRVYFQERCMLVIVEKEIQILILLEKFCVKARLEFKDGALIRYGMNMRYRALVAWFGNQDTTAI